MTDETQNDCSDYDSLYCLVPAAAPRVDQLSPYTVSPPSFFVFLRCVRRRLLLLQLLNDYKYSSRERASISC